MLPKKLRDRLTKQALEQIEHARDHKKGRVAQWKANDALVFGRKPATVPYHSNVMLPKMQGFENTLLSKVRQMPAIRYGKGEEADLKKAKRLTALLGQVSKPTGGNWKMKDLVGKKHAIRYGRAIYEKYAESKGGFKDHFYNISPYDFLIDPGAGGIDVENALFLGRTGIYMSAAALKGLRDDDRYLAPEINELLRSKGNADDGSEEQEAKDNRYFALRGSDRHLTSTDTYKFWRWCTTLEGTRYYMLLAEDGKKAVRIQELKEVFASGRWPYLSWATDPDLDEFWTPGPDDQVREIFLAQSKVVNQMLDNNEMINEPMRGYDVSKLADPSLLNRRYGGLVPFARDTNINQAVQTFEQPPIANGIAVYGELEKIQQLESGVTAESRGVSDEDKVAIYEGNQANIADRLGLLNDSYANFYHFLAMHFKEGVLEHLTAKVAIQMIGPDGIEWEEITKDDVTPGKEDFDVIVSASDAELRNDVGEKRAKLSYVASNKQNPIINQKVLAEIEAEIAGFEPDDISRLFDVAEFGDAELMSEAARDIQRLLAGEETPPNEAANVAYKQKLVDYLRDKSENMDDAQLQRLMAYVDAIEPYVVRNTVRKANEVNARAGALMLPEGADPMAPPVPQEQAINQMT